MIQSLEIGGVLSSLNAIYDELKDELKIEVFALSHDGVYDGTLVNALIKKDIILDLYFSKIDNKSFLQKIVSFMIKVIKRFCLKLNIDIDNYIFKLRASKLKMDYDAVVAFQEGPVSKFVSLLRHSNKVAWVHCNYSYCKGAGKELSIYTSYKRIVCVSNYTADIFKQIYPTVSDKVCAIYNIINTRKILEMSGENIYDFTPDNIFTIVSVGRITPIKRFHLIPDFARRLNENNVKFRWLIIGPNYNDDYFNEIMSSISKYSLENSVVYLGPKSNPFPYMKHSDLLVVLSESEACPMVFNEAKVLSIPVITTDFSSAYEFINDGYHGRIIPLEDISVEIANLYKEPSLYKIYKDNMEAETLHDLQNLAKIQRLW